MIKASFLFALALALAPLSAWASDVTIKLAIPSSGEHIIARMSRLMGKEVEKRVPGRVDWQIFEGGQLGTPNETMLGLMEGTHMLTMNGGWFQNIAPEFALFDTPFLFKNRDEARRVIAAIQDDLARAILPHGIVLIGVGDMGFRQISNNVRPIVTPADLNGVKIRTPGNPFSIETFKLLGADPTPMENTGLYLALRQGVVDGQENPLGSIWNSKYYEVQKYISMSNHIFSPVFIGVSARYWNRWPPEVQRAIREAAQVACDFSFDQDAQQEKTLKSRIQAANPGVRFNEVDTAAFEKIAKPLIAEREASAGPAIWNKVMAVLDAPKLPNGAAVDPQ